MGGNWIRKGSRGSRGDTLDALMECDHVIRVDDSGRVHDDVSGVYAPEFTACVDDNGQFTADTERDMAKQIRKQGWEPEGGWSGQMGTKRDNYVMHDSEFIGGKLAEHILSTPGYWVWSVVQTDEDRDDNHVGWVVMHREINGEG
jgi:hypothetical protein